MLNYQTKNNYRKYENIIKIMNYKIHKKICKKNRKFYQTFDFYFKKSYNS